MHRSYSHMGWGRYGQALVSLLCMLAAGFASAQDATAPSPFQFDKNFDLPSGTKVSVTLRERNCNHNECKPTDAGVWGIESGKPLVVTDQLSVSINGRGFEIPRKFFTDFVYSREVSVSEAQGKVVLNIKGGEAAAPFNAKFTLGGGCGFERLVCGAACDKASDRSVWRSAELYSSDPVCKAGG
jgi:hypothetical protein